MTGATVVVTDHDFDDLSVEREVLDGVADVTALADDVGAVPEDGADVLADADGVLNLRYELDADAIAVMDDCQVIARYGIGVDNVDLDVFPEEPPASEHPLRDHPSVLVTPHVAWYSEESNADRRRRAAGAVRTVLTGGRPDHVVNDRGQV